MGELKVFSQQLAECRQDGTAFDEKSWCCGRELIMCKRFAGLCSAIKCRAWRLEKAEIDIEAWVDLNEGC